VTTKEELFSGWPKDGHSHFTETQGGMLRLIFAEYVPLASQSPYPIIVYSVANKL